MTEQTAIGGWDGHRQLSCSLSLRWVPRGRVILDENARIQFPDVGSVAGLYRLVARHADGRLGTYIGESEEVRRRFRNYRNPGPTQQTSQRIHRWLKKLLGAGGEVVVSTADLAHIDGKPGDLSRKAMRCMFEQMAIVLEEAVDVESLNR